MTELRKIQQMRLDALAKLDISMEAYSSWKWLFKDGRPKEEIKSEVFWRLSEDYIGSFGRSIVTKRWEDLRIESEEEYTMVQTIKEGLWNWKASELNMRDVERIQERINILWELQKEKREFKDNQINLLAYLKMRREEQEHSPEM